MEYLLAVYLIPLYNFVQCFRGVCAPVYWPWS